MANTVKDNINMLPTKTIMQVFQRSGLSDLTEYDLDNALQVVSGELESHKKNPEQSKITKTGELIEGSTLHGYQLGTKEEAITGIREFLEEYLSELNWTKSQILVIGGESKIPYYTSNLIYKKVGNRRVLATPEVLPDLVTRLYHRGDLRGHWGIIVVNLSGLIAGRSTSYWSVEQHLDQEVLRASYFKTTPEGKEFYKHKLRSKPQYLKDAITFSRVGEVELLDEDNINYTAYLTQALPYRNTVILNEKTKVFLNLLGQESMPVLQTLTRDELFLKTRIYQKQGYTLVLRSRFVLIDNIRNQVIINKTPTNMAKKDIELIVRLITSK